MRIIVTQRTDDYHACIEGSPGKWEADKCINEAIRKLMRSFPELRSCEVVYDSSNIRWSTDNLR
jgi:hypothetical protein